MKNQEYSVTIKGLTPYLQHRMDDVSLQEWEKNRGRIIERKEISNPDHKRAEFHCYRNSDDQCFIPSDHLKGAMINAGSYLKSKVGNSRKSMKNIVAAMFYVQPDEIVLPDYDDIDKRSAFNRQVKGRVIVIRPKWTEWKISFNLVVSNTTITQETAQEVLEYAGNYCGIGSFRPTNNGHFGRFEVIDMQKK